jgi:hypothetical protein
MKTLVDKKIEGNVINGYLRLLEEIKSIPLEQAIAPTPEEIEKYSL